MTLESADGPGHHGESLTELLRRVEESVQHGGCMSFDDASIDKLVTLEGMINSVGMFSKNEDRDDLTALSMRCFNVPYYLALAYSGVDKDDDRVKWKQKARAYYNLFLQRCLEYDVLEPGLKKIVEGAERGSGGDMAREDKIALYKKDKQLRESIRGKHVELGDEDEDARAVGLMRINMYAAKAVGNRQMVEKEIEMLEAVEKIPEEERMRSIAEEREKANELMAALHKAARGLSSSSVDGARARVRENVFKPSHILPTMTVEEFGEIEMRRMMEEKKKTVSVEQDNNDSDDDDDDDDEAIAKARAWDDFKDSHRRGSGNSKLRPTG